MSLDGLRAWIGEVERKLGMRTRVFMVLVAIAIGGAAAGIYLALEAADESVSKDEVQALQERVGAASGETGEAAAVAALEAELETLRTQVAELQEKSTSNGGGESGSSGAKGNGESSSSGEGGISPRTDDEAGSSSSEGSAPDPNEPVESEKSGAESE